MKRLTRILLPAVIALTAVLILTGCGSSADDKTVGDKKTYRQVSPEEAAAMMEEETDYIILDVRTQEEYSEGHIEGSKNIPLQNIEIAETIIKNKDTPLFVYCRSGGRSAQATSILKRMGYTNVEDIGGILSYRGKVVR